MPVSISGRCLCGAVTIVIDDFDGKISACHCGMCRRWGGGPSLSLDGGENPSITGEEHIRRYASSEWAERAFCDTCGMHLFYRLNATGVCFVWVGLFGDVVDVVLDSQIYIDHKPGWYAFANETRTMTEAEVIAQFAQKGE